jgi:hypothetical protein
MLMNETLELMTHLIFGPYADVGKPELERLAVAVGDLLDEEPEAATAILQRFHKTITDPKAWADFRAEQAEIDRINVECGCRDYPDDDDFARAFDEGLRAT